MTAWLMTARICLGGPAGVPPPMLELERGGFCGPVLIALTVHNPYLPILHVTARVVAEDELQATARFAFAVQAIADEHDYAVADLDDLSPGTKNVDIHIEGETP